MVIYNKKVELLKLYYSLGGIDYNRRNRLEMMFNERNITVACSIDTKNSIFSSHQSQKKPKNQKPKPKTKPVNEHGKETVQ